MAKPITLKAGTINRGYLLRLAKAGKLERIGSYHYDEMMGESRSESVLPVRVKAEYGDHVDGFSNLWESDFKSSCGSAHVTTTGIIHLYVHSNCNFDLRLKAEN